MCANQYQRLGNHKSPLILLDGKHTQICVPFNNGLATISRHLSYWMANIHSYVCHSISPFLIGLATISRHFSHRLGNHKSPPFSSAWQPQVASRLISSSQASASAFLSSFLQALPPLPSPFFLSHPPTPWFHTLRTSASQPFELHCTLRARRVSLSESRFGCRDSCSSSFADECFPAPRVPLHSVGSGGKPVSSQVRLPHHPDSYFESPFIGLLPLTICHIPIPGFSHIQYSIPFASEALRLPKGHYRVIMRTSASPPFEPHCTLGA